MFTDKNMNVDSIKTNKKGFTLIELIVVILILGVIAAVAVPKITVAMEKAEEAKLATNFRSLKIAAMTAYEQDPSITVYRGSQYPTVGRQIAEAVSKIYGQPYREIPTSSQLYYLDNFDIPSAVKWYFGKQDDGIYIVAEKVFKDEVKLIGPALGYGEPSIGKAGNPNIYFADTYEVATGRRHLYIRLVEF